MITLECECCGFEQDFENEREAFLKGWDEPSQFAGLVGLPVTCNLCPGTCVLGIGPDHTPAHERWEREGRPEVFEARDVGMTDEQFEQIHMVVTNLVNSVKESANES